MLLLIYFLKRGLIMQTSTFNILDSGWINSIKNESLEIKNNNILNFKEVVPDIKTNVPLSQNIKIQPSLDSEAQEIFNHGALLLSKTAKATASIFSYLVDEEDESKIDPKTQKLEELKDKLIKLTKEANEIQNQQLKIEKDIGIAMENPSKRDKASVNEYLIKKSAKFLEKQIAWLNNLKEQITCLTEIASLNKGSIKIDLLPSIEAAIKNCLNLKNEIEKQKQPKESQLLSLSSLGNVFNHLISTLGNVFNHLISTTTTDLNKMSNFVDAVDVIAKEKNQANQPEVMVEKPMEVKSHEALVEVPNEVVKSHKVLRDELNEVKSSKALVEESMEVKESINSKLPEAMIEKTEIKPALDTENEKKPEVMPSVEEKGWFGNLFQDTGSYMTELDSFIDDAIDTVGSQWQNIPDTGSYIMQKAKELNSFMDTVDQAEGQLKTESSFNIPENLVESESPNPAENEHQEEENFSLSFIEDIGNSLNNRFNDTVEDVYSSVSHVYASVNDVCGSAAGLFTQIATKIVSNVSRGSPDRLEFDKIMHRFKNGNVVLQDNDLVILQKGSEEINRIADSANESFKNELMALITQYPTYSKIAIEGLAFTLGFTVGGPTAAFAAKMAATKVLESISPEAKIDSYAGKIANGVTQVLGAYFFNGAQAAVVSAGVSVFQEKAPPIVQEVAVAGSVGYLASRLGVPLPMVMGVSMGSMLAFKNSGLFKSISSDFKYAWKVITEQPLQIVPKFCIFIKNQVLGSTYGIVKAFQGGKKTEVITKLAIYALGIVGIVYSVGTLPITLILFYLANKTYGVKYEGAAEINNPFFREYVLIEFNSDSNQDKNLRGLRKILEAENINFTEFCNQFDEQCNITCKVE
jgi:hypothetical protein